MGVTKTASYTHQTLEFRCAESAAEHGAPPLAAVKEKGPAPDGSRPVDPGACARRDMRLSQTNSMLAMLSSAWVTPSKVIM